jgi:hypothetical protein
MKYILIAFVSLVASLSAASAYTDCQQAMYDGTRLSWQMATAYADQDVPAYNGLVDQWNAWVRANFGEDSNLLMQKMAGPVDLQKPYIAANNTTGGGVVHAIDGNKASNRTITTNDMNLLPDSVTGKMYDRSQRLAEAGKTDSSEYLASQGNYLGGV